VGDGAAGDYSDEGNTDLPSVRAAELQSTDRESE